MLKKNVSVPKQKRGTLKKNSQKASVAIKSKKTSNGSNRQAVNLFVIYLGGTGVDSVDAGSAHEQRAFKKTQGQGHYKRSKRLFDLTRREYRAKPKKWGGIEPNWVFLRYISEKKLLRRLEQEDTDFRDLQTSTSPITSDRTPIRGESSYKGVVVLDVREEIGTEVIHKIRLAGYRVVTLDCQSDAIVQQSIYHVVSLPQRQNFALSMHQRSLTGQIQLETTSPFHTGLPKKLVSDKGGQFSSVKKKGLSYAFESFKKMQSPSVKNQQKNKTLSVEQPEYEPLVLSRANLEGLPFLPVRHFAKRYKKRRNKVKKKKILIYMGNFLNERKIVEGYIKALAPLWQGDFWEENHLGQINLCLTVVTEMPQEYSTDKVDPRWQFFKGELKKYDSQKVVLSDILAKPFLEGKKWEEELFATDLFLVHIGISYFQAIDAGIPTALLCPYKVHEDLTRMYYPQWIFHQFASYKDYSVLANIKKGTIGVGSKEKILPKVILGLLFDPLKETAVKETVVKETAVEKRQLDELDRGFIDKERESVFEMGVKKKSVTEKKLNEDDRKKPSLQKIGGSVYFDCPCCRSMNTVVVHREPHFNWMRCKDCFVYWQFPLDSEKLFATNLPDYKEDYFVREYLSSYGKTYREDEANIKALCGVRKNEILKILLSSQNKKLARQIKKQSRKKNKVEKNNLTGETGFLDRKKTLSVLDIGAAYGYFLDVMGEDTVRGERPYSFETYGMEISKHAAKKIDKKHKIKIGDVTSLANEKKIDSKLIQSVGRSQDEKVVRERSNKSQSFPQSFPLFSPLLSWNKRSHYDVISMWYTIEHFTEVKLKNLIAMIASAQKIGGVLALSTPNALGVSCRKDNKKFLLSSPSDHFFIFSPQSLYRLLDTYGYKPVKVISTGLHLKRLKKGLPYLAKVLPNRLFISLCKRFRLGDTMEVYFVKEGLNK